MNPPGGYSNGTIYILFSIVKDGTVIYLSSEDAGFAPVTIKTGSFKNIY